MDDDDFRRGRPTAHRVFGEAMALLAGDALFALAFQLIPETPPEVPRDVVLEVWRKIAAAAGTAGMVGGQVMDMLAQGHTADLAEIEQIHRRKTGALLETSVVVGGMLGGGSEDQVRALSVYGRNVGLAFQIADDVLDIMGDAAKLGKPIGSDERLEKSTYPSVIGIERSRELAVKAMNDAIEALSDFDEKAEPLRLIARFIVEREV
jgi:geranylgeranyl diphosphate synthase type II